MADEDTAPGEAADAADAAEPTGAIEQLAANARGLAVMWASLVACTGLSLWQLSEATLRARRCWAKNANGQLRTVKPVVCGP